MYYSSHKKEVKSTKLSALYISSAQKQQKTKVENSDEANMITETVQHVDTACDLK